ncbi:5-aminolevulinate synthase [Natronohydrobacter thiooxidans]|uniref:5-aminolevulinate synthase n=1 Tax=Natronohydrobacter thiooxidans TaxID=87172 RepID=UPI00111500A8|nr:5-aminolevulinate synthase [Natronohydrobacter thiooxidans]
MPADTTLPEIASNPHILRWIVILILAAAGYTVATVGLKLAAERSYALASVLIFAGFLLVIVTQIFLLRRTDLTIVYVTIIGVETLMILAVGAMMGEVVDMRRILGAGCVVAGIALVSS